MKKFFLGAVLSLVVFLLTAPAVTWALPVTVLLEASSTDVSVGDFFTIDILADIPDPVLGWGLDLSFDSGLVSQSALPSIDAAWMPGFTMDGDGLAGVIFPASTPGTGILLASLTFEAMLAGSTTFAAGYSPLDFTEGFPLEFPGGFAEVSFENVLVTINSVSVPEPGTLMLFGIGLAVFGMAQKRANVPDW